MIRVMLVDDEPFTRVAVKTLFDWEGHGFRIIAEANNGESALLKLKYELPDLIVTDMRMPITDGASFIRQVKERWPNIKCIALSAYDDFNLARSAFLEGAADYLLKGDLSGDNSAALEACLRKLFPDAGPPAKIGPGGARPGERASRDRLPAALAELASGGERAAVARAELDAGFPYVAAKLSVDLGRGASAEREGAAGRLMTSTVLKIISEISEFRNVCAALAPDEYLLLVYDQEESAEAFFEKLRAFLESLWANTEKFLNAYAVIGVGSRKTSLDDFAAALAEAEEEAQNIFYDSASGVYFRDSARAAPAEATDLFGKDIEGLPRLVEGRDWEGIGAVFERLCAQLRTQRYAPEIAKRLMVNLVFVLQGETLHRQARGWNDLPGNEARVEGILRARSMSAIAQVVSEFIRELKGKSEAWDDGSAGYSALIGRTVSYLHQRFRDPRTNLNSAADALGANASYLSRCFDQETGIHFSAYLTRLRLAYAKNLLLASRDTVAVVAERCGYPNTKHFFNLFKKAEGTTPAAYRARGGTEGRE